MLQKLLCTISPQGLFSRYILYTIIHVKVLSPSQDFSLSTCVQCFSVSVSFGCNKKIRQLSIRHFLIILMGFRILFLLFLATCSYFVVVVLQALVLRILYPPRLNVHSNATHIASKVFPKHKNKITD